MTDLKTAAQRALEAWDESVLPKANDGMMQERMEGLRTAIEQALSARVPNRAFLERTLAAMEGVIDVADRNTDEFEALRSCVMELTLMLDSAAPQPPAQRGWVGLTDEEMWKFWWDRPEIPDGEDDSMEAQFVGAARAIESKLRERNGGGK